jgi:hypothetical protein
MVFVMAGIVFLAALLAVSVAAVKDARLPKFAGKKS